MARRSWTGAPGVLFLALALLGLFGLVQSSGLVRLLDGPVVDASLEQAPYSYDPVGTSASAAGDWGAHAVVDDIKVPTHGTSSTRRPPASSDRQSVSAAEGGSALAQSSSAAFRAADGASGWAPSAKHLAGAGGRWNKFSAGSDPAALAEQALRSPGAVFRPDAQAGRFIVETDMGRTIGTRGESWLKIVVGDDGRIITGYPAKR